MKKRLAVIMAVILLTQCGKADEGIRSGEKKDEKPVKGTVWITSGGETTEILHFRDGKAVTLKEAEKNYIKIYEYDYERKGGVGIIYIKEKLEVGQMREIYNENKLKEWGYIKEFKKEEDEITYDGKKYGKTNMVKVMETDKIYR